MNESELTIYWKNGSVQRFVGCDDIDKHRGINPKDVVFDEYSEMDERIWSEVVQPVLRQNGGTASFLFTPKGINHSYRILELARGQAVGKVEGGSGVGGEWYWSVRGWRDTGVFSLDQIREAKATTTESIFRQEYECSFESNAGSFFRGIRESILGSGERWRGEQDGGEVVEGHSYQLGVDLAKYNDWTVLTPVDLNTMVVQRQVRFNQVDWNLQKARIEAEARRWNNAVVKIDRTGVGDPIVEDLIREGLNINFERDAIKFTQRSKMEMLVHLAIMLEQGRLRLPVDEGLVGELEAMQYEMQGSGRLKFVSGLHDDRVMSLALGVHGVDRALGLEGLEDGRRIRLYNRKEDKGLDRFSCF